MATRQEMQMAWDLIRFTNVANDLFDDVVLVARGQKQKGKKITKVGGLSEFENMTIDDIKVQVVRTMQNIRGYTSLNLRFLGNFDKKTSAVRGLAVWGVNIKDIIRDNRDMDSKAIQVSNNVARAVSQAELNVVADFIEVNIPNLRLVRKS